MPFLNRSCQLFKHLDCHVFNINFNFSFVMNTQCLELESGTLVIFLRDWRWSLYYKTSNVGFCGHSILAPPAFINGAQTLPILNTLPAMLHNSCYL
ncbi:hypothetical protein VNO77_17706 [Canavalia gladiata]|uniref:Uncharacterized protein n=1 Tax=Canavalia gladiata TaxID=3824 RepID=A0AAN9QJL5_CANGL